MPHPLPILDAAHSWDLSMTSLRIMCVLQEGKIDRPSMLGRRLSLTPAGIGCAIKELCRRRIVSKQRIQDKDERAVTIKLTTYGTSMLESVLAGKDAPEPAAQP